MSLLLTLKQRGLPLPGGALLFCPFVDLTGATLKSLAANDPQVATLLEHAIRNVDAYLDGHQIDDPIVSPLTADLTGLPPMLIQAATGDAQREDAQLLTDRARAHGVDAHLELYPVETHAFQTFWSFLPEAREGVSQAGRFVQTIATRRAAAARPGMH
jgi:acetyl esterase/lipase